MCVLMVRLLAVVVTMLPQAELQGVLAQLADAEPLVAQRDVQQLTHALAEATKGNSFLLMGGDCAETFKEFSSQRVRDTYDLLQQVNVAATVLGFVYPTSCSCLLVIAARRWLWRCRTEANSPSWRSGG